MQSPIRHRGGSHDHRRRTAGPAGPRSRRLSSAALVVADIALAALGAARDFARSVSLTPNEADRHGLLLNKDGQRRSAFELLSHPNIGIAELAKIWPRLGEPPLLVSHAARGSSLSARGQDCLVPVSVSRSG